MQIVETFPSHHNYYIHDVKYDFYGERLVTCSSDHHIKVWDKVEIPQQQQPNQNNPTTTSHNNNNNNPILPQYSWKCSYDWKAHNGSIWKLEWAHPEYGQVIASCSYDHTVNIWEEPPINTGPVMLFQNQQNNQLKPSNSFGNLSSVSSSGGGSSGNLLVNQGNDGNQQQSSPNQDGGLDGNNVSTSTINNMNSNVSNTTPSNATTVQQPGNRKAWLLKATLVDSTEDVVDIKFAPRHLGLKLATCSLSGKIRIYDALDVMNLAYWTIGYDFDANNGGKTYCMSWCPYRFKEPMIVVGCDDGKIRIWYHSQGHRKWQPWVPSSILIPNGTVPVKPILLNDSNASSLMSAFGHNLPVHDVSWSPNLGRSYDLIASASKDGSVRIWKVNTESKVIELMEMDETHKHNSEVWKVEWNLSGTVLASSGDDGIVRLWKYNHDEKRWKCESIIEGKSKNEK